MGFYIYLQAGRTPFDDRWRCGSEGPDFDLTEFKTPCLAELMLFDDTSLVRIDRPVESGGPYLNLISDTESAVERYRCRLPRVRHVLRSDLMARRTLDAFGEFIATIDMQYVRLATDEYRIPLSLKEDAAFNEEIAFAVAALDLPSGFDQADGAEMVEQYVPGWERLLDFCCYNFCGIPYHFRNKLANLLSAHLPRRGVLNISHFERARRLLDLTPEQEDVWRAFEEAFRPWLVSPSDWGGEKLNPINAEQMEISLNHHSKPLMATLSTTQTRAARRMFRAMGLR